MDRRKPLHRLDVSLESMGSVPYLSRGDTQEPRTRRQATRYHTMQRLALAALIDEFARSISQDDSFSPGWQDTELAMRIAAQVRLAASEQRVIEARDHV